MEKMKIALLCASAIDTVVNVGKICPVVDDEVDRIAFQG
jgi:hypothetical protein